MCRKFSFFVSLVLVLCLFGNAWGLVWGDKDIGNPGIAGSSSEAAGTWTILGSGHDIWGNADGIHYVYRPMSGDGSLQVNLVSMDNTSYWAKVGPAIREDLGAGSKHAMTAMTGGAGIQYVWRTFTNGGSDGIVRGGETWPSELRITRSGDTFVSEFNYEWLPGLFMWTPIGDPLVIPMSTEVTIGMVVCATNNGALNTAVLDNVVLTAAPYEKPWDLSPAHGTSGLPTTVNLSWMPGDSAASHDVLLGTDPAALALVATKALGDESYTTDPLAEGTSYYWQIVEQPLGVAGPVMRFNTARDIGAGLIDRCLWEGIGGTSVSDLTGNANYPCCPTWCDQLTVFDSPQFNPDKNDYGGRMQGLLVPETSGNYTFWIAADDGCELWLSTNDKACDASLIAYWTGWTGYHAYDWNAEQMSASIPLVAGERYFIRALWKEGGGGDHCSVAWEGPDAPSRTEIDGYYVLPGYVELEAGNLSPADGATLTVEEAAVVSWAAGATAVSHNVYLGTDPAALSLVATVAMPATTAALPGIAVDTTYYWTVEADDGTTTYPGCTIQSFSTAEWVSMDVGGSWGGSATKNGDCWTIVANGGDIWGGSDAFHFLYQTPTFTRDTGTLIAHVTSLTRPNHWTKAGVMFRETTAGNSINSAMLTTPPDGQNSAAQQWRDGTGWGSGSVYSGGQGGSPEWVKLVREGNVFKGYYSEDGINWTQRGTHTTNMNSFVRVGLAVTSHDWGLLATAEICDFTITTPDPRQAWGLDPANEATFVDIHTTLKWNAGEGATEHRVYFSQDEEAVVNRTVAPVILPAETTELYVGPLDLTTTHYWAVDEVVNPVIPGEVFSFTVENYRTIDDFESYDIEESHPDQEVTAEAYTVSVEDLPEQEVEDPGYTIPGYTVVSEPPDAACLLAEWAFEGNFDDTSGSGFHGTAQGDAAIVSDGTRGDVLSLDGDGDYVDCGNPSALNFGTGNWSVSLWIKTAVGDAQGAAFGNGGDGGGGHRYSLGVGERSDDKITLITDDDSSKVQVDSTTNVADDAWHNVIGVRDGDKTLVYVNGILEGSEGLPAGYDLSGCSQREFLIGAIYHHGNDAVQKHYTGLIDDVQVYQCALTEGNARFAAGLPDKVVDPIVVPPSYGPLMVHYEFEDDATDSSGNGRDGTETAGRDGDMPTYTAGMHGQAISFIDKGDHVLDDDSELYMDGLDELTIACWIKSNKVDRDEGWVHFGTEWSDRRSFRYDKDGGSSNRLQHVIKYGVATTTGNEEDESSDYVQTTNWQHVAMTWQSGQGLKLYIDGLLDEIGYDDGAEGGVLQGYSQLLVGRGSKDNSTNESWNGLVDDLRIYSTALSYGQIRNLAGETDDLDVPPQYGPMIAAYDFEDGDARDTSGNNIHGTLIGDTSISDGAANFDGNGDCIDLGHNNLFNPGTGPFSISAWINMSSWGGSWGNVIIGNRGEGGRGWQLRRRGGDQRLVFTTRGCGNDDPGGNINPSLNAWHHVVAIREGTSKKLFIDGVLDNDASINTNWIRHAGHNVFIGGRANRDNNNNESHFNGKIGDVRVYHHALTYPERLYLSGYRGEVFIGDTWAGRAAAAPALEYWSSHEGDQCMRVEYTGSGAVTRLEPFGDGKHPHGWNGDFSLGQAQALSLWFKGDPENAPGSLFAQLTTVVPSGHTQRVVYDGDPGDLLSGDWVEWNITLKALSTGKPADPIEEMGLPITKIKDVGIGVIGAGGGVVYIDDIRLQPVRCVPKLGPAADLDDDCDVDRADALLLVRDFWLANPGIPGVRYEYFEDYFDGLNDFDARAISPTRTGVKANFDISGHRGDGFGYRFKANIEVPVDGTYTFYTSSDDGSKLYIDGIQVVDNDGFHGMRWREGDISLSAGLHDIMVTMFEWGGGEGLLTEVAGPGIPRMAIPDEVLFLPYDPAADLNDDGMVNFLDYSDILNSFIDAVLWPQGGDLL
jgi:hypothetical protein